MAHFYINDKNNTVEALAVIGTDRNPKIWQEKLVSIKKPELAGLLSMYSFK